MAEEQKNNQENSNKLQKGDFIEIEFTGKTADGEVFDSNREEDLKKLNPNEVKNKAKPFTFCLGEGMFLEGVDEYLQGKEAGKEYTIELPPEKAFGKRKQDKIQRIPMKTFREHNIQPYKGAVFNFDNQVGKVIAVSGGRVIVDFNDLLAGKDVVYDVKVNRKVTDLNEKTKSFLKFLFRKDMDFEINDNKLILYAEKQMQQFAQMFKQKFKDILGLDLEVREPKEEKEQEKKEENK